MARTSAPVGWVERSETHQLCGRDQDRWVSLRSTHPTLSTVRREARHRLMRKFTYDSTVLVSKDAPNHLRPGQQASVFGVFLPHDRKRSYFDQFAPGVVYSIEYGDGDAADIHEDFLESL